MRRYVLAVMLLAPALLALGCTSPVVPVAPPPGYLFGQIKAPLSYDYHQTPVAGKAGRSTSLYVCFPFYPALSFAWRDDASVANSAANGGLTQVEYADYELKTVLGCFSQFTVVAYGQ